MDQAVTIGHDASNNPICIADTQRRQGTYVVGLQGMGKSTMLLNMILQDIEANKGICVIDPHRDLVEDILTRANFDPSKVVLLDPADFSRPFGLNLFECQDPTNPSEKERVKSYVMDIFKKLWGPDGITPSWGPQLESILNHLTQVFVEAQEYTLIDVPRFLLDDSFRHKVLKRVSYKSREYWLQVYDRRKDRVNYITATLNRVTKFTDHELLYYILGQSRSTIDFSDIMDQGKVVLVRLTEGHIGKEGVTLIGSLITGQIIQAMMRRIDQDRLLRRPFAIYCDEFQLIATADFPRFFTEGRKFGLQTLVAHQARYQLDRVSKDATAAVANRVSFRLSPPDASVLSDWFESAQLAEDRVVVSDPIKFLIDHGHPNPKVRAYIRSLYRAGYEHATEYQKQFANPDPKSELEIYNLMRTGKWSAIQQRRVKCQYWAHAIKALNLYFYLGMTKRVSYPSDSDLQLFLQAADNLVCALADPPNLPRPPADPWDLPEDLQPSKYVAPFNPSLNRAFAFDRTVYQTERRLAAQERQYKRAVEEYRTSMIRLVTAFRPICDAVYHNAQLSGVDGAVVGVLRSILYLRKELAKSPLTEPAYKANTYGQVVKARDPETILKTLPEFHALATFGRGSEVDQVMLKTERPREPFAAEEVAAQRQAIREYAHRHYTRSREQVGAEIQLRQGASGDDRPTPKVRRTVK